MSDLNVIDRSRAERRAPGPRTRRRQEERRKRLRRRAGLFGLVTLAAAGLIFLVPNIHLDIRWPFGRGKGESPVTAEAADLQDTWLVMGTVEAAPGEGADWLSVFSWDRDKGRGFVMYLPKTTLVEIPGHGGAPEEIGRAMALGNAPLQISTTSNLLGIQFDHYLVISDQAIRALFDKVGGIELEVNQRLSRRDPDGRVQVIFAEGRQPLDGKRVAEYLTYSDDNGDEISRSVRHAEIWSTFFENFRGRPAELSKLVEESMDLFVTDAEAQALASFLATFPATSAENVIFETLPVSPQGVSTGVQFYRAEAEAVQSIIARYLAASRPKGAGQPGRRIQILNGNGVPGIGEEVANMLVPKGFRLVLDANAKNFDYEVTQIVVYSDSKQALAIGQEIREILGVGEILISKQQQTIVDVTIVVGKDYLQKR